jgi:hypothetical protein
MLFWRLFSADWLIVGTGGTWCRRSRTHHPQHTQQHRRQAVRVFSRCNTIPLGWKKHGDELYIDKVLDPAFPFRSRSCSSYSYSSASSLPSHVYPYIIQPGACVFNAFAEWAESTCLISIPPPPPRARRTRRFWYSLDIQSRRPNLTIEITFPLFIFDSILIAVFVYLFYFDFDLIF